MTLPDRPDWPKAIGDAATVIIDATLDAIGRQALKDIYGAFIGDRITAWRADNLANVFRKYQEASKGLPPQGRRFVAEKVGIRFIEEASLEDSPELQQLWANLLAAAVNKEMPDITARYVSAAKELLPIEVLFLNNVYDRFKTPPISDLGQPALQSFKLDWPLDSPIEVVHFADNLGKEEIIDIVTHLIGLGIARRAEYEQDSFFRGPQLRTLADPFQLKLTKFGWDFICAANGGAGVSR